MKRYLYRLEDDKGAVIVYKINRNIGRIGVVFKSGLVRRDYGPKIPRYIVHEAKKMLKGD